MQKYDYLEKDLSNCKLCEWQCSVNRLEGEKGVCGISVPKVASSVLHPAPPASFDAFLVGCNFRCLFCQNWSISTFPDNRESKNIEGYYEPRIWARLGVEALNSISGRMIRADRLFFTGGEPTCSLPWVEEVVREARRIDAKIKVNYDTNGFLTKESLKRVLKFTTSITYDIKAYNDSTFRALTGASVEPVLRNAEFIARVAREKIWEFRIMVIPNIHEKEIPDLCEFLAGIDPTLPVCFLSFRPNFVLEGHAGASNELMEFCMSEARRRGLENVAWSGCTGIKGKIPESVAEQANLAMAYAVEHGCVRELRSCGECIKRDECKIKRYIPKRRT